MGLDNFAVYGKDHDKYNPDPQASNSIPDELFPKNNLVGGISSGGGNFFRGKVYNDLVEYFTGYTLYEDVLDTEAVENIYTTLSQVTEERFVNEFNGSGSNTWEITYEEVQNLTEWFGVVASEAGCVISWY